MCTPITSSPRTTGSAGTCRLPIRPWWRGCSGSSPGCRSSRPRSCGSCSRFSRSAGSSPRCCASGTSLSRSAPCRPSAPSRWPPSPLSRCALGSSGDRSICSSPRLSPWTSSRSRSLPRTTTKTLGPATNGRARPIVTTQTTPGGLVSAWALPRGSSCFPRFSDSSSSYSAATARRPSQAAPSSPRWRWGISPSRVASARGGRPCSTWSASAALITRPHRACVCGCNARSASTAGCCGQRSR